MLDSKTRAKLRSIASTIQPSVIIGKDGVTENVVKQINMDLDARELIKITVLENDIDYKELLNDLAGKLNAEPVCSIGKKLVLYRYSSKKKVNHVLEEK